MENASKAILIAGSVIIVLLIISLAMYFYNQSVELVDVWGNKITSTEIKNHNNTFLVYDGELRGIDVISACIKVEEYNTTARLPVNVIVKINNTNVSIMNNYYYILNNVKRTVIYTAILGYDDQGIINLITFEPKT